MIFIAVAVSAQNITSEVRQRAAQLVKQMTLEEKIDYIGGYNKFYIRAIPRLGIPEIRMADGPQGVRNETQSTMYPCGIAAAASWNPEAVYNMGVGLGQDSRARGVHILLGPGVNIYRAPLCGRNFEYFGEDPHLAAETAIQYIKGVQSQEVMATIKHFAGNNQEYGRHHVSSDIDERTLHEIYLPAFRRAIHEAGVGAVMSSYNPLNGVHTTENRDLAIDILRDQWGFEGIYMSDWNATYSAAGAANRGLDLEMPDGRFMNRRFLLPLIENGVVRESDIDIKVQHILQTLISFGFFDRPQLDGSISELNEFSNEAALNLARESAVLLRNEGGLLPLKKGRVLVMGPCADTIYTGGGSGFVHPFYTVSAIDGMKRMGRQYKISSIVPQLSYDLSATGIYTAPGSTEAGLRAEYFGNVNFEGNPVLVRTETKVNHNWDREEPAPGLPKDKFSVRWSGVVRYPADQTVRFRVGGDDGYRLLIDGEYVTGDWANHKVSFREAELNFSGGREYAVAFEYYDNSASAEAYFGYELIDKASREKAIKSAAAVVLCVGFNSSTEKENADRTFSLPEGQDELIERVAALNGNVVVVVNSGGGIAMPWIDRVKGVLMVWYPGQEGGLAIAEMLTGKISPSGKLPVSIEKCWEDNPVYGSYYPNQKNEYRGQTFERVNYDEGVFVGYRGYDRTGVAPRFHFGYGLSYSTFTYSNISLERAGDGVSVSFDVNNTGKVDAAEVAQVYVSDVKSSVPRPLKELKGFEKVYLRKGETRRIAIELPVQSFAYYDVDLDRFVVEPGEFVVSVGGSSDNLPLRATVEL